MALANRIVGAAEPDLLCVNLEGELRYANRSACDRLGYEFADLVKKKIADYSPNYSKDVWEGHCRRTISNGADQIYTYHKNCKGHRYPVVIYSVPYVVTETSEQLICSKVQNAQSSVRYKRMLEMVETSQRIGSFDFNLADHSILASESLMAMMGTTDPEVLKPAVIADRLSKEDAARWNLEMIHFINGYHRMDERFVMRTIAGQQALVRVVIWSVMREGNVTGITGYYALINESGRERLVSLEENQRQHIIKALRYTNGRVTGPSGAGKLLDINGKTLFARMKKLNIKREDYAIR